LRAIYGMRRDTLIDLRIDVMSSSKHYNFDGTLLFPSE
jgi:hypothetical protein